MLKLIWREEARAEARAIVQYIADEDPAAAERIQDAVDACAERLQHYPFMYRAGRIAGTREAVAHPNYILIYRVSDVAVEIVSLVHARQQYP